MTTISFSVEDDIKRKIDAWAKQGKKSKSAVLRDLVAKRDFEEYFEKLQERMRPVRDELGLETDDDIYEYLESGDTYEERKAKVAAARLQRP